MIQDFKIIHRRKPQVFTSPEFPVWSTCLRSLAFVNANETASLAGDELYTQAAAYRFLLETICGLKSPIVGETEVFGQFKAFSALWLERDPRRAGLVQRLLSDAKAIRSIYLSKLGTQSYGSWLRKSLRPETCAVHFVGAGILSREILPYVLKLGAEVTVHSRDVNTIDFHDRNRKFAADGFTGGALVVAAPVSAAQLMMFLGDKIPTQIFDLRETSRADALPLSTEIHGLHQIFAEIEKTKALLAPRLVEVRREISERAGKAFEYAILRPQGWDDLCA